MADSNETTITINPAKQSEVEFEVSLSGIDDINIPSVRFVATSEAEECDYSFKCKRIDGSKHKWKATIPKLSHLQESTMSFRVEVIVDGYFFEPASGKLMLVHQPTADMKPKKQIYEADAGPEVTTMVGPSNRLLVPEENPEMMDSNYKNHDADEEHRAMDEFTDERRLDSIGTVTPGDDDGNNPEEDGKEEAVLRIGKDNSHAARSLLPANFDAKSVAEAIVKDTLGKVTKPITKGTLFKRDAAGKAVVKGIDTLEVSNAKAAKAARVKAILQSTSQDRSDAEFL